MIDWAQVQQLRGEVGAEDFDEVVELFLEEVDEIVDRLRTSTSRDNLESDLHFLKGSALNLGFADFSSLCQTGEQMSANGQAQDVDLASILNCYDASRAIFLNDMSDKLSA
ncbi:MAG: Hpt domain-containing protein [Paracoccaceae bacterium]